MLEPIDKARAMKKSTLFEDIPLEDISRFVDIVEEKDFPADFTIFKEGEPGDVMYIIVSGEVLIQKELSDGAEMRIKLGVNDCFGEMAILDGLPRSATVTVTKEGTFLSISRQEFRNILRVYPEIAFKVISVLSIRLRNMGTNLTKSLREQL